jgi:hypothetical protein
VFWANAAGVTAPTRDTAAISTAISTDVLWCIIVTELSAAYVITNHQENSPLKILFFIHRINSRI